MGARAFCVVVMLLGGCAARLPSPAAPSAGWVDLSRVRAESALGKRLDDEHATVLKSRQDEAKKITDQLAEAVKRKDKDLDAERAVAAQRVQQLQGEVQQHENQVQARLWQACQPIAAKLGAERHLTRLDPETHLWAEGDLTEEVIRRLDAQTYAAPTPKAPGKP